MASAAGLTSDEAAARLAAEGPNRIPGAARRGMLSIIASVVREPMLLLLVAAAALYLVVGDVHEALVLAASIAVVIGITCLLYTSPSPRDISGSRMPSSA